MLTDEPLILRHPRRALGRLLVAVCAAAAVFAAAAAVVAYQLSDHSMRQRVETLETERAQRRQEADAANRVRDARLEQTRRDLCVVVDRVQPRDTAVQDLRRRYGCTETPSGVTPAPAPSPPDGRPGGGTGTGTGRDSSSRPAGGTSPAPRPGPSGPAGPPGPPGAAPPPPPPPADPEPEPTDLLDLCVPLLDLCL